MTEQAGSSGVQRMRAGYDTSNRLVSTEYALSPALDGVFGEAKAYGYTYNEADGSLSSMTLPENGSLAYTYDGLKRLTARQLKQGENEVVKPQLPLSSRCRGKRNHSHGIQAYKHARRGRL